MTAFIYLFLIHSVSPCRVRHVGDPSEAWNDGFLSASNSLGSSRSGVQRHLHRVADCIPGRQITRLRHNHVLAAGFFPYRFTFGLFSFVIDGWETFGVPSL
jgi:hypothetical protein